jgi:Protein of unknown function (DUF1569)
MTVDTKTVQGRRELRFTSIADVIADAERLAAYPDTKILGNWPLSQLFTHLATAVNGSIDGMPFKAPWFIRLLGPFIKGRVLRNKMSPGLNLSRETEAGFFPAVSSQQEALQRLRTAVGRLEKERMTARHPVFGKLTHDEWTQLHLRHAELHLSFAVPVEKS